MKILLIIFFLYIKMTSNYYQQRREAPKKVALEKYQNLLEENKDQGQKKTQERHQSFTE